MPFQLTQPVSTNPLLVFRHLTLLMGILLVFTARSQTEYFTSLNYQNLSFTRVKVIPDVYSVVLDNSAYDANHQRFFFKGSTTSAGPFYLYTMDAVSGSVIYKAADPKFNILALLGLQYDNTTDTLYAIYSDNLGIYFSWVEPSTGTVHYKKSIPNKKFIDYMGYSESTYDSKDHLYIFDFGNDNANNGDGLFVINALTGDILYDLPDSTVLNIMFDNATGKLYGIDESKTHPDPQFDSITVQTGALHPIVDLPYLSFVAIFPFAYTIDENAGKYISPRIGYSCRVLYFE